MKVSVIVPIHRPPLRRGTAAEGPVDLLLEGLDAQTRQPDEIIVVCDRVPLIEGRPNVICVVPKLPPETPDYRPQAVMNVGAGKATGDILIFTHAFAAVRPDWIEQHLALLDGHSLVTSMLCLHVEPEWEKHDTGVGGRWGFVWEMSRDNEGGVVVTGAKAWTEAWPEALPLDIPTGLSSLSCRAEDYRAVNGLDERFDGFHGYGDNDLGRRLIRYTGRPGLHSPAVRVCRLLVGDRPPPHDATFFDLTADRHRVRAERQWTGSLW